MSRRKATPVQPAASRQGRGAAPGGRPSPAAKSARGSPPLARAGWLRLAALTAGLMAVIAVVVALSLAHSTRPAAAIGKSAPNGAFTTTSGRTETVSALRGQPSLLWFVTTWCSSCQAGTAAMARQISQLAARHVHVVELENAGDLGQSGPAIDQFAQRLAGPAYTNPDWTFGTASSSLTAEYSPQGYLDIYYLLDAAGRVVYVNSSPSATMGQLLSEAAKVG